MYEGTGDNVDLWDCRVTDLSKQALLLSHTHTSTTTSYYLIQFFFIAVPRVPVSLTIFCRSGHTVCRVVNMCALSASVFNNILSLGAPQKCASILFLYFVPQIYAPKLCFKIMLQNNAQK